MEVENCKKCGRSPYLSEQKVATLTEYRIECVTEDLKLCCCSATYMKLESAIKDWNRKNCRSLV